MKTSLPQMITARSHGLADTVQLAHGSGGRLSAQLVEEIFLPLFDNDILNRLDDQAVLQVSARRLAFTTDAFVVAPLFFPGGNIGDLAVNGTVNDLCMCGAEPRYLSASFIIEEGFGMADLRLIVASMQQAARKAGVAVVTGDTKVVPRGCGDGIFITTSGVGLLADHLAMGAANLQPGDKIILSGTIADHGMAVLTSREQLSFASEIVSDTAALNMLVARMVRCTGQIHAMRDPTRGGLAATLNELARASGVGIELVEQKIPVREPVRGACELLGIDPLQVANEGKLVAAVAPAVADELLREMRQEEGGEDACVIGEVVAAHAGLVTLTTGLGVKRIVDMPAGELLPRIC